MKKAKLIHCVGINPRTEKQEPFYVNAHLLESENIGFVQSSIDNNSGRITGFGYTNVSVINIQDRNFKY